MKKIEVIRLTPRSEKEKMDTIDVVVDHFSKNNYLSKRTLYRKPFKNPYIVAHFDTLGRITNGSQVIKQGTRSHKFYYNKNNLKSDSINHYWNNKHYGTKYKNYFQNNMLIRQDDISRDTLRTFVTFEYDSLNRLIRKIKHNTKFGTGMSFGSGFTKDGKVKKILDPNDTTRYKYKTNRDTLITYIYRKGKLRTIEKKLSIKGLEIKISENHRFGYVSEKEINYKWSDSTRYSKEQFNKKGKTTRYNYRTITDEKIISTHNFLYRDEKNIIIIKTTYDKESNWIRKEYVRNGELDNIVNRKIEYFEN